MLASFVFAAVFVAVANAHTITLRNNCPFGVGMTVSNFPNQGAAYTGNTAPDIPAGQSFALVVPTGWNGRICDRPPNSGCENNCFGGIAFGEAACSMTEWTFDSANIGGNTDYDISNIQGFSVAQQIIPGVSGDTLTCTSANCPCNEAYRPGDTSGTCGGTGPVDQATRVGASSDYTVVYCP
ncbi:COP8 protein [Mycena sanguinolenta]|uniref:COP8 protein n=1 Tax=Mycena sanguinolenta TaxID=230812 RepID=A0A8H6XHE1_9AGAR|nr:COP8 protein [Mycena sanguinolenta]